MTATASPVPQSINGSSSSPAQVSTPKPARARPLPQESPQPAHHTPRSSSPRGHANGSTDIEGVLRHHGGDARKALEAILNDRNGLQAQNAQLWKLIEKQRTQCASLVADNERLRSDRERANSRLTAAGLDPLPTKKMSNSSSAVGLGLKAEAPAIRRHNSDRDEKTSRPLLQVPSNLSAGSTPPDQAAATVPLASSSLLPSPLAVQDTSKLRRESRMAFPPEVSSFMTLADSPRDMQHTIPQFPPSASSNTLSPASMYSEHPSEYNSAPPPSSRALGISTDTVVEEPEGDEHFDTATLPPRYESLSSGDSTSDALAQGHDERIPTIHETRPSVDNTPPRPLTEVKPPVEQQRSVSSQTRLSPALLPHARLSIPNSTVFPNALGRDVLCFIVSVTIRPPNAQLMSWTVAKLFSAFIDLDTKIKAKSGKGRKEWKSMVAPLPEGRAWKDFAPSKIDQRKKALEAYIQSLLVAPLSDKSDLCDFLSTDKVLAKENIGRKEGYLTKKGKNFGGWKTRYFVLDGPVMEYYEQRGGTHLGSIVISGAQIGRQNRPSESSDDRDFRHAFLIIEQMKKGGLRHVLCAESDSERDNWIDALVRHVEPESPPPSQQTPPLQPAAAPSPAPTGLVGVTRRRSNSRKSSRDVIVTAAQPMANLSSLPGSDGKFNGAPSPSLINSMESKRATQQIPHSASIPSLASHSTSTSGTSGISAPSSRQSTNPAMVANGSSPDQFPSSPPMQEPTPRANKRQSMVPAHRPSHSAAYLSKVASEGLTIPGMESRPDKERDRKAKSGRFWPSFGKTPEKVFRPVFGVPLSDSITIASKANLPAIVFRCIEYLEANHAETEEGIYRLSGSSAVIKGLKDRFDQEGDVNLLQVDEHWDPHAIGGLLKTFLRDLPHSLLTRDLHPRFLAVMDLIDSAARVSELSRLVSELPPYHYALLRALTAHLILIVRNSALNKMTLRNIGIVFSPTLGIPAGIFSELVSHFGAIFDDEPQSIGQQETLAPEAANADETVKRKRNSMLYQAGGADQMLGLGGRSLDPSLEDSASEADTDEAESEALSMASDDNHSTSHVTPRAEAYPSAAAVRKAKAAAKAADKGLTVETAGRSADTASNHSKGSGGLPASPRPDMI